MRRDTKPDAGDAKLRDILSRTTAAAQAVSSARPGRVFEDLALALARILATDAALIAQFVDERRQRMRTLALCMEGRLLREVEYNVAHTPCRHIVGRESRFISSGVGSEFAPGTIFAAGGFDAYAGYSIPDSAGEQAGIIVALDRKPIADRELTEALLKIFATRAGAEIDRLRAETALRASETSYRAIFEAAEDAIFVHDRDTGRILDVNSKACSAYGWPREEMLACSIEDFSADPPPCSRADAMRHIEAAKSGAPVRFEWHRRNRDGSLHWDEVVLKSAVIDGAPRILAFTREITERKQALEALQQREEQYREIFNASADALVLWNKDLRIVDVNPAFLRTYGFARGDIVGAAYPADFPREYVDDRLQLVRRALAGEACELQTRAYRANGQPFDVDLRVIPIRHRGEPHVLAIARDITERRGAEEQLRASEARYRLLFETESDAILLVDAESLRLVDVNRAAMQMYGFEREELLARTALDLSTDPEQTRAAIQKPAGAVMVPLRWHRRRDGTVFPVEINANRLQLDGRTIVVAAIRDITERKRAEQALRASEEQYRSIFNASADAMVLRDAGLRLVDANAAFLVRHGVRREDVIGGADMTFITPDCAQDVESLLRVALAGHGGVLEARTVAQGGTVLDIEVRAVPMQYDGKPHVLSIARDITERRAREAALRASEEQYRTIFNASADALVLWDSNLKRVDVNPAYERIFGWSRDEVIGHGYEHRNLALDYAERRLDLVRRALAGEMCHAELESVRKSGEKFRAEIHVIPIQYGGAPHVLAIVRDITERWRAEEQRALLESQLRQAQKMEAIGQLTGGIAHDFNNILASVMGYLVLAEERATDTGDDKSVRYLSEAQASCRRARDLIQQMLTFSRGGRGEPRAVSLTSLVQDALPMLRSVLPSTLAIDVECDPDVPTVWIDELQAYQILLNLAINARDAMNGTGRLRIGVACGAVANLSCTSCRHVLCGPHVELAVTDTGSGIAPELLERIFDPFFTTKEPGKGTGMGLSVVHGIVHEHGGHVVVETATGAGSTFRVLWPVGRHEASVRAPVKNERRRRAALNGRVLLVDDEPAVLDPMRELLEGWGLDVTAVSSPGEAQAAYARDPDAFDLLVTDYAMPLTTGLELAARLRALKSGLRWLLCTGFADEATVARAKAQGADAVLGKPVEPVELRAALERCLSSSG